MITKVRSAIQRFRLVVPGQHVLLAISGGADSMAMMEILHALSFSWHMRLTVAHLDHGIRGNQSRADARFVREQAARLKLRCIVGHAKVPAVAQRTGMSLEEAARQTRYDFLARTARRVKAQCIATAHQADDQAETVLFRIVRGSGVRGLGGIPRVTLWDGVPVVRPLLSIPRTEIIEYLRRQNIAWREDGSNRLPDPRRNRIRMEILPLLERALNPAVRQVLVRTADIMREEDQWMEVQAIERLHRHIDGHGLHRLNGRGLQSVPAALRRRMVRLWLTAQGLPSQAADFDTVARVEALAERRHGSSILMLVDGWRVRNAYGILELRRDKRIMPVSFCVPFRTPGECRIPVVGCRVSTWWEPVVRKPDSTMPGLLPAEATLSPLAGRRRLTVRSWMPGDRFRPLGMSGTRKLQDIFTDTHVPRDRRAHVPLVCCGDEIIWIPGYRVAQGWQVVEPGQPALQIRIEPF